MRIINPKITSSHSSQVVRGKNDVPTIKRDGHGIENEEPVMKLLRDTAFAEIEAAQLIAKRSFLSTRFGWWRRSLFRVAGLVVVSFLAPIEHPCRTGGKN